MLELKDVNGKTRKRPTKYGEEIGILLQFWGTPKGTPVAAIFYSEEAQHFIIDNIDAVIATEIKKTKNKAAEN